MKATIAAAAMRNVVLKRLADRAMGNVSQRGERDKEDVCRNAAKEDRIVDGHISNIEGMEV
jgi:hypothetical protein